MFPEGWHFIDYDKKRDDVTAEAKYYSRSRCPPKYFLTDFGISRRYNPADGPPLEDPIIGGDKTVPEFQKSVEPCNPFPTDIYYAGNLIREYILQVTMTLFFTPIHLHSGSRPLGIQRIGFHVTSNHRYGARRSGKAPHHRPSCRSLRRHPEEDVGPEAPFTSRTSR
jgi:hypothetical protein